MDILNAVKQSAPTENVAVEANTDLDSAGYESLYVSMQTLFAATFGDFSFQELRNEHRVFGPFLMLLYMFVGAVMLINLLIALLSDVYQKVQKGAREEFSFSKAKTVASNRLMWCGKDTSIPLPAPLNLITFWLWPISWFTTNVLEWDFPLYTFCNASILVILSSAISGVLAILVALFSNLMHVFTGVVDAFAQAEQFFETNTKNPIFRLFYPIVIVAYLALMVLGVCLSTVFAFLSMPYFILNSGESALCVSTVLSPPSTCLTPLPLFAPLLNAHSQAEHG